MLLQNRSSTNAQHIHPITVARSSHVIEMNVEVQYMLSRALRNQALHHARQSRHCIFFVLLLTNEKTLAGHSVSNPIKKSGIVSRNNLLTGIVTSHVITFCHRKKKHISLDRFAKIHQRIRKETDIIRVKKLTKKHIFMEESFSPP